MSALIAKKAAEAVRKLAPVICADLETVPEEYRPFDLWPLLIANFLAPKSSHTDFEDYHAGFCCCVPLGQYNGGELKFPGLQITLNAKPGDIILFRSDLLEHQVLPYEGMRMSLIFTSHGRFMKSVQKNNNNTNTSSSLSSSSSSSSSSSASSLLNNIEKIVQWREDINKKRVSPKDGIQGHTAGGEQEQSHQPSQFPLWNGRNRPPTPPESPARSQKDLGRRVSKRILQQAQKRINLVIDDCKKKKNKKNNNKTTTARKPRRAKI